MQNGDIITIGYHAYPGTGKDTAADALVAGLGFHKIAFADALYEEVCVAFGVEKATLQQRSTKEVPHEALTIERCSDKGFIHTCSLLGMEASQLLSPREVLQSWGTDYRRQQLPTYWTDKLRARYKKLMEEGATRFIIPDIRFPEEANLILSVGGVILGIDRPGFGAVNNHTSEQTLPFPLHNRIMNDSSIEHLKLRAIALAEEAIECKKYQVSAAIHDTMQLFSAMLYLQDSFNRIVHKEWHKQGYPWHHAIWTEAAELAGHIGWEWWKHTEPNAVQCLFEFVDIFCFGSSLDMVLNGTHDGSINAVAKLYAECYHANGVPVSKESKTETLARLATFVSNTLKEQTYFSIDTFFHTLHSAGFTLNDLYTSYLVKAALNRLRQAHGYKSGEYKKTWLYEGRMLEDNHASFLLAMKSVNSIPLLSTCEDRVNFIYRTLEKYYLQHVAGKTTPY